MEIKTKRLILRKPKLSDAREIVKNLNNLNITKWLLVVPYPYKEKDAKWWINKTSKDWKKKDKKSYQFGIILKENNKYIGGIGLSNVDTFQSKAEVGYWLGEKYWKNGYRTEALGALLSFAFRKLKLRRLEAGVFEENPSSGRLLEKYNFKLEGTKIKALRSKANKKIYNEKLYGLLKENYK